MVVRHGLLPVTVHLFVIFYFLSFAGCETDGRPCFETCGCGIFALQDRNGAVETERGLSICKGSGRPYLAGFLLTARMLYLFSASVHAMYLFCSSISLLGWKASALELISQKELNTRDISKYLSSHL